MNSFKTLISIAVGLVTLLLLSLFIRHLVLKNVVIEVQGYKDAMQELNKKLKEQEAITDSLYKEVAEAKKQIKSDTVFIRIKEKGYEKMDSISNLSINEQFSYFSKWLSENDSTGK